MLPALSEPEKIMLLGLTRPIATEPANHYSFVILTKLAVLRERSDNNENCLNMMNLLKHGAKVLL